METDHWIVVQNINKDKLRIDVMVLQLPRDARNWRSYIAPGTVRGIIVKCALFEDDPGHPADVVIHPLKGALGFVENMREKYAVLPEHIVVESE